MGIVLPFAHCRLWSLKEAPLLVEMGRDLQRVLEIGEGDARDILRKLLQLPKQLASLPQCMARGMLHLLGGNQVPDAGYHIRSGEPLAQCGRAKEMDDRGS